MYLGKAKLRKTHFNYSSKHTCSNWAEECDTRVEKQISRKEQSDSRGKRGVPKAPKVEMNRQYCTLEILKSLEKDILKDFCSQHFKI